MRKILAMLLLGLLLTSCTSSAATKKQIELAATKKQVELAGTLYSETIDIDSELAQGERVLPTAIPARDAAAIEALIIKADDLKRSWHKMTAEATGPLAEAAKAYEDSLGVRTKAYEAASRTARLRQVEDSREMVRLQRDGWQQADDASAKMRALNKK